jgi:carboxylate-amine ligase
VIEQRFGESPPFSVGVEEEIMILDAESLALEPAVAALVGGAAGLELPGRLKTELFASVVELNTHVCDGPVDALAALGALRRAAAEIAARNRLRLAAAGSHPFSRPEEQTIAPDERYRTFVEYAGITARRQGCNGLHVHVGMPSADACIAALEGVLGWLPVVLALSANSPYLSGEETGLLSTRAEILALLPRRGAPPAFHSYGEWERFVAHVVASGLVRDYTAIWWDVRPHPRFGTLEIRMPDQPTSLALTGAFAALLQALCAAVLRAPPREHDPGSRGIYDQNRWAASRFGTAAQLIHPDRPEAVPVAELTEELLALVRPVADELGTAALLDELDPARCEAERQLEIGRAGGLEAVCADLVERSAA